MKGRRRLLALIIPGAIKEKGFGTESELTQPLLSNPERHEDNNTAGKEQEEIDDKVFRGMDEAFRYIIKNLVFNGTDITPVASQHNVAGDLEIVGHNKMDRGLNVSDSSPKPNLLKQSRKYWTTGLSPKASCENKDERRR